MALILAYPYNAIITTMHSLINVPVNMYPAALSNRFGLTTGTNVNNPYTNTDIESLHTYYFKASLYTYFLIS